MIGTCDNCDRHNVPVRHFSVDYECGIGSDTTQCFLCTGDTDPDPYGEMDETEPFPGHSHFGG